MVICMMKKISFVFIVLISFLFISSCVNADSFFQDKAVSNTLKSAGLIAGNYLGSGLITSLIAGGNKAAENASPWTSGLSTLGSLSGLFLGSGWGAGLGAGLGVVGGIVGMATFSGTLYTVERGLITRIVSLKPLNVEINDPLYLTRGSDQKSSKFEGELLIKEDFYKKSGNTQYQYIPVKITKTGQVNNVESVVLKVNTEGLPDYVGGAGTINTSVLNPTSLQYMGATESPYSDALQLGEDADRSIGWCEVNDEGKLLNLDEEVSKMYVEDVAKNETKRGFESFVLLLKNINPLEENLSIPQYNCFGPNGLTGTTGKEAMPKVQYSWAWNDFGKINYVSGDTGRYEDLCSKTLNDDYIYCDATQFTQTLFARLNEYDKYASVLENKGISTTAELDLESAEEKRIFTLLTYKAFLMKDGFTKDFLEDFEEYATQKAFLNIDEMTKEKISQLIANNKLVFRPLSGESTNTEGYKLPYAGYYNVTIELQFNETSNYDLFENQSILNSNLDKIVIYFELISQENNPFYNMPLDATVGVNDQGIIDRIGYGVDYSGDAIWFKNSPVDGILLEPTLRSNSTPIVSLNMAVEQDVDTLNGAMRGTILRIVPKATSFGVTYDLTRYLSVPASVDLTLNKETDGDAYAFYTISFNNEGPFTAGNSFILWSLICKDDSFNCESFSGLKPTDEMYVQDIIGASSKAPVGQLKGKAYGLFWDKDSIIKDNAHTNATYRGLLYMPEIYSQGSLDIVVASDKVVNSRGLSVTSLTFNKAPYAEPKADIQGLINQIEQENICVTFESGNAGIRFWWNPAKVLEMK